MARELALHPATARCLAGRGVVELERAQAFLDPRLSALRPPIEGGMAGFPEAVDRLARAILAADTIGIFGDYDVDGVTTTALLTSFLRRLGARVVPRVAQRAEGYGFSPAVANELADGGCRVILTVDCGTSDVDAILCARGRGIDVIVVDHHQVPDRGEHPAVALLNPHRPDSRYPFRGLCSVGLGFFLAAALRTDLKARGFFLGRPEPDVRELLDLVAIGTIADMAPLGDENRVLVTAGLRELTQRRRPGVAALLARAGVELRPGGLTEIDVAWKIAPRLNAPGRLGDAAPALDLLLAVDADEADDRAAACDDANLQRRTLSDRAASEAFADAEAFAGDAAITVARPGWHPGVVGIVAAKLAERYGKPACVIAIDAESQEGRGSVRTAAGLDVHRALAVCREHLVRWGGHKQAAGLTVDAARVDDLRRAFAGAIATASDPSSGGRAPIAVDALVGLGDVDRLAREVEALAPFGPGNAEPAFAVAGARVSESRRVGEGGAHLKLTLECEGATKSAIAFRMGDRDPGPGAAVDVAFRPEISYFRGEKRVELRVHQLWPATRNPG
jgi:single-stranded-DNA-specific exonuclease